MFFEREKEKKSNRIINIFTVKRSNARKPCQDAIDYIKAWAFIESFSVD